MRETPSGIFCDHLRETSTSAHLISCCLTDGRSVSFLRQNERTQKARKLGLPGLSASFPHINFALLKRRYYVIIQVQTVAFHRGKNPDLCTLLQKGVGENGDRFAEERQSNPFMHTRTTCRNPKMMWQTRSA